MTWDLALKLATFASALVGAYLAYQNLLQHRRLKNVDMRQNWILDLRTRVANLLALTHQRRLVVKGESNHLPFDEIWHKSAQEYAYLRLLLNPQTPSHRTLLDAIQACLGSDVSSKSLEALTMAGIQVLTEEQKRLDTHLNIPSI